MVEKGSHFRIWSSQTKADTQTKFTESETLRKIVGIEVHVSLSLSPCLYVHQPPPTNHDNGNSERHVYGFNWQIARIRVGVILEHSAIRR